MSIIKKLLREAYLSRNLLMKERRSEVKINKKDNLWMHSKGFLGHSKIMYEINKENHNLYLTDRQQTDTGRINKQHAYLLNNKVAFEQVFNNYVSVPKTLATILNGEIFPLDSSIKDINSLMQYIQLNDKVIIKPISGSKGQGIYVIKSQGSTLLVNNKRTSPIDFQKKIGNFDEFFVSEYINQGSFGNKLNPETVNTVRIMTMIDPETKEAFIPAAVQRIGTARSAPTDNFSKGGLNAKIDLKTGILSKAVSYPYTGEMAWHEKHPDTNQQIEGTKIPDWEEIQKTIIHAATKNSYIKYVGWDVVLTDNGIMIMEGNSWPDIRMFQIHDPLLTNKRVEKFYKHHGIIK